MKDLEVSERVFRTDVPLGKEDLVDDGGATDARALE